jgi:hypothetical protein
MITLNASEIEDAIRFYLEEKHGLALPAGKEMVFNGHMLNSELKPTVFIDLQTGDFKNGPYR